MATTTGITFDLGLPDGSLAVFRYDNAALMALERECGEVPILRQIADGQWTTPTVLLVWAGRLHQEGWPVAKAAKILDRYEKRSAGDPPARPNTSDREARRAYRRAMDEWREKRGEAVKLLRLAVGDAMVESGAWTVNVFDEDAIREEAEGLTDVEMTGAPEDVSGVEVVDGGGDDADPPGRNRSKQTNGKA